MIRVATAADIPHSASDECLIRIISYRRAYGCDVPFIRYYTDEAGGYLAIMDGAGVLHLPQLTEEWCAFLSMCLDIHTLHCAGPVGRQLQENGGWQGREGVVMRYAAERPAPSDAVCTNPYLPKVYALLEDNFPGVSSLNDWYPDVSHRVRHQCCHIACIQSNDHIVSTAMTVAETITEAIIGQVATAKKARRQGYASICVKSIISQCEGKTLYILPIDENAAGLYSKIGFVPCGSWFELEKTY